MSRHQPSELQDIENTVDCRERMHLAVEAFNRAMESEDYETAREISEYVIGSGLPNRLFGTGFQLHCLNWLAHYYRTAYAESQDGSAEEQAAFHGLMNSLWRFKWVVANLPYDAVASREDIERANRDIREWYAHFKISPESVEKALTEQSITMGDAQAAQKHYSLWQQSEADGNSDCAACKQNTLILYHHFTGDYAQVLELARPILNGKLGCTEVPHITYPHIIDAQIRLGHTQEAEALLHEAAALITASHPDNIRLMPFLILAAERLGKRSHAIDWLEEYGSEIIRFGVNNRLYYLYYLMCCIPYNEDALTAAQEVAQQFDGRNGNSYYQDMLALQFEKAAIH